VTSSTAAVTMTVSSGAEVVGTSTVNAVNGVATFTNVGLSGRTGTYTLSFAAPGLTAATQSITLTPGAANALVLTTNAAGAASGVAFTTQPVVAIRDAAGNTVTSSTAAVTLTMTTGSTQVGTSTATAVNGVATFSNVSLAGLAGSYTLTYAAPGLTSASQTIDLTPGAATRLVLTTNANGAASGAAFTTQPVVAVRDAAGNTITGSSAAVTLTVTAGTASTGARVRGTGTVNALNGVATFSNVGLAGPPGTYTLTYSAGALEAATQSITLAPGAPASLVLVTTAAGAASGAAFTTQPVVAIRDGDGNTVTPSSAAVTMSVSTGGTVVGTSTVNAASGVATFTTVGLAGLAGTYTLTFTSPGLSSASVNIDLAAGAPATLAIITQPVGGTSGAALATQPVIEIRDAAGNRTTSTATVTAAIATGTGGTLSGAATVAAVNGRATFTTLAITGAGTFTLGFSSAGVTGATSGTVTITTPAGITVAVGANATATGNVDRDLTVPLTIDLSNRQSLTLGLLSVKITFDPNRLRFRDNTVGTWRNARNEDVDVTINRDTATLGWIHLSGFADGGTASTQLTAVMSNLVFVPVSVGTSTVSVTINQVEDAERRSIRSSVSLRNLTVTVGGNAILPPLRAAPGAPAPPRRRPPPAPPR
ncbi:MAG: hypothetical protein KJT01_15900, partial [Gemmatimonadetes bacterium]|nr:hypothetical protein [Gemmatimonadota bacterium]